MVVVACYMTKTRLMGALAGYIDYRIDQLRIVEFYHIEFEEYGIDRFEQLVAPSDHDVVKMRLEMFGRLGGEIVALSEVEFSQLIAAAITINRQSDSLMQAVAKSQWLPSVIDPDLTAYYSAINKLIESIPSQYAFGHYFLMRYFAQDSIYKQMIKIAPPEPPDYYTLLLNQLTKRVDDYHFSALLLGKGYASASGTIHFSSRAIQSLTDLKITAISEGDAAALLRQNEHIVVYQVYDQNIESHLLQAHKYLVPTLYPNGRLYIKYRNDDKHLNQPLFRLNDDVEVYIYVTDGAQLLLVGNSKRALEQWHRLLIRRFSSSLRRAQTFNFDSSILYDFILSNYDNFDYYLDDYGAQL